MLKLRRLDISFSNLMTSKLNQIFLERVDHPFWRYASALHSWTQHSRPPAAALRHKMDGLITTYYFRHD